MSYYFSLSPKNAIHCKFVWKGIIWWCSLSYSATLKEVIDPVRTLPQPPQHEKPWNFLAVVWGGGPGGSKRTWVRVTLSKFIFKLLNVSAPKNSLLLSFSFFRSLSPSFTDSPSLPPSLSLIQIFLWPWKKNSARLSALEWPPDTSIILLYIAIIYNFPSLIRPPPKVCVRLSL